MKQRIVSGRGREIAALPELKQIGRKGDAGRDAFPEQLELIREQNKPPDQIGCAEHDNQRRKDAADTAAIETGDREGAGIDLRQDDPRDQKTGNDEEDVDPDKSTRDQPRVRVIDDDEQDGNRPQSVDIGPVGCFVLRHRAVLSGRGLIEWCRLTSDIIAAEQYVEATKIGHMS